MAKKWRSMSWVSYSHMGDAGIITVFVLELVSVEHTDEYRDAKDRVNLLAMKLRKFHS